MLRPDASVRAPPRSVPSHMAEPRVLDSSLGGKGGIVFDADTSHSSTEVASADTVIVARGRARVCGSIPAGFGPPLFALGCLIHTVLVVRCGVPLRSCRVLGSHNLVCSIQFEDEFAVDGVLCKLTEFYKCVLAFV